MHTTSPSFDSPVRSQIREHLPLVLVELFALIAGVLAEPSARMLALLVALLCTRHGLLACVATFRSLRARRAARVPVEVRPVALVLPVAAPAPVEQKTSPYDCHGIAQAVEAVMATKKNVEPQTKITEQ